MRTIPPPGSKYVKDWVGKRIRTKVEMQNGYALVPIGATGTVTDALSGLRIKFDACTGCGFQLRMNKVSPYNVEVIMAAAVEMIEPTPAHETSAAPCERCGGDGIDPDADYHDFGQGPEAQPRPCKLCVTGELCVLRAKELIAIVRGKP